MSLGGAVTAGWLILPTILLRVAEALTFPAPSDTRVVPDSTGRPVHIDSGPVYQLFPKGRTDLHDPVTGEAVSLPWPCFKEEFELLGKVIL